MTVVAANPAAIQLPEWRQKEVPGLALAAEDRALAAQLRAANRLLIDELRGGLRVSARSWVGVVRFSHFEVQVRPKLAGDNLGLVGLLDYVGGLGRLRRYKASEVTSLAAGGDSLFDLIALLFADACERLIRGGILSDYREVERDLPMVRGRVLADKQVIRRFGRVDRLECRYDEYLTDILDNQILAAALALCGKRVRNPGITLRIRRLQKIFFEACSSEGVDFRKARQDVYYYRMNEVYREPHQLAFLIADGLGVSDLYGGQSLRSFAFLLDMNRLFELFVAKWITHLFQGSHVRVLRQKKDWSIIRNAADEAPFKSVIPDLLLESRSPQISRLPVDAKYKIYDERHVSSSDVYQSFLYAFAYGSRKQDYLPSAFLIYPAPAAGGTPTRLHIRRHEGGAGAEIVAMGIYIPGLLKEVEAAQSAPLALQVRDALLARLRASAHGGITTSRTPNG